MVKVGESGMSPTRRKGSKGLPGVHGDAMARSREVLVSLEPIGFVDKGMVSFGIAGGMIGIIEGEENGRAGFANEGGFAT